MALSRSLKDVMRKEDGTRKKSSSDNQMNTSPPRKYADGGSVQPDKWMQKTAAHTEKGALHRNLGIPMDKKISTTKLEQEKRSGSPLVRKEANLALNYRGK